MRLGADAPAGDGSGRGHRSSGEARPRPHSRDHRRQRGKGPRAGRATRGGRAPAPAQGGRGGRRGRRFRRQRRGDRRPVGDGVALCRRLGLAPAEVTAAREHKRAQRGGFDRLLVLEGGTRTGTAPERAPGRTGQARPTRPGA